MIRKIPQDTASFHFYNANPKGLRASDCVVRAICTATNNSWERVHEDLFLIAMQLKRMVNELETYNTYLNNTGWSKRPCPKKGGTNYRFTGEEFAEILKDNKVPYPIIANIGGQHVVCFREGKLWDIWDSTDGAVGIVWIPSAFVSDFINMMSRY